MKVTSEDVKAVLARTIDPLTGLPVASMLKQSEPLSDNAMRIVLAPGYPVKRQGPILSELVTQAIQGIGVQTVEVSLEPKIVAHAIRGGVERVAGVKNIIAVASGKGGVGKSTTAVNIALALRDEGAHVGLLDADIYGPSVPLLLGTSQRPDTTDGKTMTPIQAHGLQASSIGFLVGPDSPAIWRGPMVTQALEQLLKQTNWQDLDYLVVDMPPGTGDVALTMAQRVPVTGAVIVTTPQDIALLDARKGLRMFQKVDVPVLGVIENMAVHICSNCGHVEHLFGQGGGQSMAKEFNIPCLGSLPLSLAIRTDADRGQPTVVAAPESETATLYRQIAIGLAGRIAALPKDMTTKFPSVVVEQRRTS